jgi:hypothetical protein
MSGNQNQRDPWSTLDILSTWQAECYRVPPNTEYTDLDFRFESNPDQQSNADLADAQGIPLRQPKAVIAAEHGEAYLDDLGSICLTLEHKRPSLEIQPVCISLTRRDATCTDNAITSPQAQESDSMLALPQDDKEDWEHAEGSPTTDQLRCYTPDTTNSEEYPESPYASESDFSDATDDSVDQNEFSFEDLQAQLMQYADVTSSACSPDLKSDCAARVCGGASTDSSASSAGFGSTRTEASKRNGNKRDFYREKNDNDQEEDDENDDSGKRRKTWKGTGRPCRQSRKNLACPYYKHDQDHDFSSRACSGPGWDSVHRIKYERTWFRSTASVADRQTGAISTGCMRCAATAADVILFSKMKLNSGSMYALSRAA